MLAARALASCLGDLGEAGLDLADLPGGVRGVDPEDALLNDGDLICSEDVGVLEAFGFGYEPRSLFAICRLALPDLASRTSEAFPPT